MKKLCIFDFDGTLFDSVEDVVICFNKTLSMHNFDTLTYNEYIEILGGNIDEMVSLILKDKNTKENIELIKSTYVKIYSGSNKEHTLPFPDIKGVLEELQKKDIILAINSNRTTESIKAYVDKYFSDIDFIGIEGHDPDYPSKPNPMGVNKIMKKADVDSDETIYIGDSRTDIKTSQNAGIDCVIVKWGYGTPDVFESGYPSGFIEDAHELLEIINE